MSEPGVHVLDIFGQQYSIRATAAEEQALKSATAFLQQHLAESEQRYPHARTNELLVFTALNLCVPLLQLQDKEQQLQVRLEALIQRFSEAQS